MVRYSVTFYGRVQGVGFRIFVKTIANYHSLTGFVYNTLNESCVIAEFQGPRDNIDKCIASISRGNFYISVSSYEKTEIPIITPDKSFYIK